MLSLPFAPEHCHSLFYGIKHAYFSPLSRPFLVFSHPTIFHSVLKCPVQSPVSQWYQPNCHSQRSTSCFLLHHSKCLGGTSCKHPAKVTCQGLGWLVCWVHCPLYWFAGSMHFLICFLLLHWNCNLFGAQKFFVLYLWSIHSAQGDPCSQVELLGNMLIQDSSNSMHLIKYPWLVPHHIALRGSSHWIPAYFILWESWHSPNTAFQFGGFSAYYSAMITV